MIRIHLTPETHDVPLAAVSYSTDLQLPQIVRLIPEPLIRAETLGLETLGLNETTHAPVGYTPKRAVGFPAWAILTDPGNAQHALNLVADVEWARRKAKTEAGAVKKRIDKLTATLQNSAPHFLPTFLEEIARIFALAGNSVYAKQYFTKARDVERVHALPIDNERHAQVFAEYATLGAISAKAFSQEARDAAARMTAQDAYDYFFGLVIDQAKTGAGVYANAVKDLHTLGKKIGKSLHDVEQEFVAAYLPTRSFAKTPDSLLSTILARLPQILSARPELGDALYAAIPEKWMLGDYVDALVTLNLWEPLCADPNKFVPWLESTVSHGNRVYGFFRRTDPRVLDAIERNSDALQGLVLKTKTRQYHLDYLDALIGAGVDWSSIRYPDEWRMMPRFDGWVAEHYRDLKYLLARPAIRAYFLEYLYFQDLAENWDVLLSSEAVRGLVREKLENLREQRKAATGSRAAWASVNWSSKHITDPRLREINPRAVDEILHIDPAEELAERLRRGTLVEYTWPAFEKGAKAFVTEDAPAVAAFPHVAAYKGTKLRLFDGATTRSFTVPRIEDLNYAIVHNDDVLIVYQEPKNYEQMWMWLSEGIPRPAPDLSSATESCSYPRIIEDSCYIGAKDISAGQPKNLGGVNLGFGPTYVAGDHQGQEITILPGGETIPVADFHARFAEGNLPGLDIPAAATLTLRHGMQLSLRKSFTAWATDTTAQSPFGVDSGRLYGLVFHTDSFRSHYVSPLGTFQFNDKNIQFAVAKPGGGVWFVGHSLDLGHVLYHPATETEIAHSLTHTGAEHVLSFLPPAGLHHLRIRNEKVSAAMRTCTTDQAAELIDNPERILAFADGDQTLAAAIAGMIAEIGSISQVKLSIPALGTVPEYLTYLYQVVEPVQETTRTIPAPPKVGEPSSRDAIVSTLECVAEVLADPRDSGDVILWLRSKDLLNTVGREKVWLSWLASPGLPLDTVRQYHKFLTWCVEQEILGTWRRIPLPKKLPLDFHEDHWYDKTLIFAIEDEPVRLWNPALSDYPTEPLREEGFDEEFFVPKDEFLQCLDQILAWHKKRTTGTAGKPAWSEKQVAEAAAEAAAVTVLPPNVWARLFAGAYSEPSGFTPHIDTEYLVQLLGVSQRELTTFHHYVRFIFGGHHLYLLGKAWHEDYLTQGPSITGIQAGWEKLWGKPWIHLTDHMWAQLPSRLLGHKISEFYSGSADKIAIERWTLLELLPVYVHVAHMVTPGTLEARDLAERIMHTSSVTVSDSHIPLGCDYDSPQFESSFPSEHSLRLAREGYFDSLVEYLKSGTPTVGVAQDPHISAPTVVSDVAETLKVSADAARYFLQILALVNPTDTNVRQWNGWSKKHLEQVRDDVLEHNLVVQAQRAGAGRSVFLSGGWLNKSDSGPAMEVWKAPHYLLWKSTKTRPIVDTCPPILPYPNLFAEVWERYKSGDTPGYEKLTTKRYRSRR